MLGKIPLPSTLAHEQGLLETIWLLFTSVLVVPAVCKLPGGSPVLGFLAGGALIGPHALGELRNQNPHLRHGEPLCGESVNPCDLCMSWNSVLAAQRVLP